jgi:putative addiction module killer protein
MIDIRETQPFTDWMTALRDTVAKAKIASRIRRMAFGNFGDVAPVGEGVSELRIHYGPGYRVYFIQHGNEIIVLLCGGNKKSQSADIESSRRAAAAIRKELK